MICVCCKKEFLFSQIKNICISKIDDEILFTNKIEELKKSLQTRTVKTVFFDSEFFCDTAEYRSLSPNTKFIVIGRIGFEDLIEKAILRGASDFLLCPSAEDEVLNCFLGK